MSQPEAIIEAARWSLIFKRCYVPCMNPDGTWFPKRVVKVVGHAIS